MAKETPSPLLIMPQSFAVDFARLFEINDGMPGQLIHILAMFVDHFLGFWPFARDKTNVTASGPETRGGRRENPVSVGRQLSLTHVQGYVLPAAAACVVSVFSESPLWPLGHAKCIFQLLTRADAPVPAQRNISQLKV